MQPHADIHGCLSFTAFTAVDSAVARLGRGLREFHDLYREHRSRRQATAILCGHTDRELADLGFTRADIPLLLADGRYRRVLGV